MRQVQAEENTCAAYLAFQHDGSLALAEANEVSRNDLALMNELVKGVLAIGPRLAKVHFARRKRQGPAGKPLKAPLKRKK